MTFGRCLFLVMIAAVMEMDRNGKCIISNKAFSMRTLVAYRIGRQQWCKKEGNRRENVIYLAHLYDIGCLFVCEIYIYPIIRPLRISETPYLVCNAENRNMILSYISFLSRMF